MLKFAARNGRFDSLSVCYVLLFGSTAESLPIAISAVLVLECDECMKRALVHQMRAMNIIHYHCNRQNRTLLKPITVKKHDLLNIIIFRIKDDFINHGDSHDLARYCT